MNFFAIDDHVGRCGNTEANLISGEAHNGDDNIVADPQ
jgi:hypothetical protein